MKIDKSLMAGSTTLLVLSLLSREEMYGYQMITELARRSDHTFELKEGTRVRKYYRITKKGWKVLEEKKAEWTAFTEKVNAVVCGTSPA